MPDITNALPYFAEALRGQTLPQMPSPKQVRENIEQAELVKNPQLRQAQQELNVYTLAADAMNKTGNASIGNAIMKKYWDAKGIPEDQRSELYFSSKPAGGSKGVGIKQATPYGYLNIEATDMPSANTAWDKIYKEHARRTAAGEPPMTLQEQQQLATSTPGITKYDQTFDSSRFERQDIYDANTNKVVSAYVEKGTGNIASVVGSTTDPIGKSNALRKEYEAEAKDMQVTAEAYRRLHSAPIKDVSSTGFSDISLVFNFMKMLDPNSVVRESEYATAANAASVPERVRALWNQVLEGTILTEPQRRKLLAEVERIANEMKVNQSMLIDKFNKIGQTQGLEGDLLNTVSTDYFEGIKSAPPSSEWEDVADI